MRLLYLRAVDEPACPLSGRVPTERQPDQARRDRQSLSLRSLSQHPRRRPPSGRVTGRRKSSPRLRTSTMPAFQIKKEMAENGIALQLIEGDRLPAWAADAPLTIVGVSQPRLEGRQKVSGRAIYSADVRLPGQLYAR